MRTLVVMTLLWVVAAASAAPSQKFIVQGLYPGMPKAEAKRVGLGACDLRRSDEAVVCSQAPRQVVLGGLPVARLEAVFKGPGHARLDELHIEVNALPTAVRDRWRASLGRSGWYEDYEVWEDGGTQLSLYIGRRLPAKATITYDPARERAIKQEAQDDARRKALLKRF